ISLLPALGRAADGDGPLGLPALGLTDASWLDTEHVRSELLGGARDCTRAYRYSSRADARMLSGTLLGADLSPVAALSGVTTQHTGAPGTSAVATPSTAPAVGPDAHAAPLSVTALSGVASGQAASVVVLPAAGQEAALLHQTAYAASDGEARSAAGAVTDTGAVRTTSTTVGPDGSLPGPAVVDLAGLAPGVSSLAGLKLQVGALSSTAMLDGCLRDETGAAPVRDYRVAGLRLRLASPAVVAARQSAVTATSTATSAVRGLESQLVSSIKAISGLSGSLTTVTVHVDLAAAVDPLLNARLGEGSEVVVDLGRGVVEVDLERLLSGRGGLNGRAPGTELVLDQLLLDQVTARVDTLLTQWATSLQTAVDAALRAARVVVDVRLLGLPLLALDATVAQVVAGTAQVQLVGAIPLGSLVPANVASLVTVIVRDGLQSGLFGPTGAVATLGTTVRASLPPVTAAASTALSGLRSAISLVVNDRRDAGGVHDVAALRITALAGFVQPTALRLATSSVGPVVELP
ncbi:choice-of-anchor G family protein, partial [Pseudokineococcus marinus]